MAHAPQNTARMRLRTYYMPSRPVLLSDQHWFSSEAETDAITDENRLWLTDTGSLTARLKALFHGNFQVDVLFQDWDQPTSEECAFLAIPLHEKASIREVLLVCEGIPMVFARSILPETSLTGKNQKLLSLKNKPLGEFIFAQPDLKRGPIEITRTTDLHGQMVWGRRSRFTLDQKPLSVCEYFLPALFARESKAAPLRVLPL